MVYLCIDNSVISFNYIYNFILFYFIYLSSLISWLWGGVRGSVGRLGVEGKGPCVDKNVNMHL